MFLTKHPQKNYKMHNGRRTGSIKKRTIILIFLLGLTLVSIGAYTFGYKNAFHEEKALPNRTNYPVSIYSGKEPQFKKEGELIFLRKGTQKKIVRIDIEIADNPDKRAIGLMFRSSLPDNAGMLFIYEKPQPLFFWMKNTYIPLDIIFANGNMQILTIHKNTKPLSEKLIPSYGDSLYVVEVNAKFCDNYSIKVGDYFRFETKAL